MENMALVGKGVAVSRAYLLSGFDQVSNESDSHLRPVSHKRLMSHMHTYRSIRPWLERGGAGVETQKNVRGEIGGWGRVPFNEPYAPLLSTIYDGA